MRDGSGMEQRIWTGRRSITDGPELVVDHPLPRRLQRALLRHVAGRRSCPPNPDRAGVLLRARLVFLRDGRGQGKWREIATEDGADEPYDAGSRHAEAELVVLVKASTRHPRSLWWWWGPQARQPATRGPWTGSGLREKGRKRACGGGMDPSSFVVCHHRATGMTT
jgi:hypothetical protein